ncbi:hypothetical protein Sros01_59250 [Streptomyces roseochromogenus]|nr:hypothetical protein Sros01_59250 [Streptomyces roseochromogenus]
MRLTQREGRELTRQPGHGDDLVDGEAPVAVVAGPSFVVVAAAVREALLDVLLDGLGGPEGAGGELCLAVGGADDPVARRPVLRCDHDLDQERAVAVLSAGLPARSAPARRG